MQRFIALLRTLPMAMLLAACGTPRPVPPPAVAPVDMPASSPAPAAPGSPVPRTTLASEQVRLAELFRGTPVVFSMQQDGSLRTTVPRRFSFDAGKVVVKPPLAAVLDRLAKSQFQTTTWLRVSVPTDPPARSPALARDRATAVRERLVAQGIAVERLQTAAAVQIKQVEIVIGEPAR